jgi:hypothetical protein
MRLHEQFLKCVCFLAGVEGAGHNQVVRYRGTAFFTSVPAQAAGLGGHFYLVTARHNVTQANEQPGERLHARLNTVDGGSQLFDIHNQQWFYPDDPATDVAVLPCFFEIGQFDFAHISLEMFLTLAKLAEAEVGIGDDIVVSGLFALRAGSQRNLPLVRNGILTSMPQEKLEDQATGLLYDAYLAQVQSQGGFSGSPVFVLKSHVDGGALVDDVWLLGLVRGHWDYRPEVAAIDFANHQYPLLNTGVAIVTPIDPVYRVITETPELVGQRQYLEAHAQPGQ